MVLSLRCSLGLVGSLSPATYSGQALDPCCLSLAPHPEWTLRCSLWLCLLLLLAGVPGPGSSLGLPRDPVICALLKSCGMAPCFLRTLCVLGSHLASHLLPAVEQPSPCCSVGEGAGGPCSVPPFPAPPGTGPAPWRPLQSSGCCWRALLGSFFIFKYLNRLEAVDLELSHFSSVAVYQHPFSLGLWFLLSWESFKDLSRKFFVPLILQGEQPCSRWVTWRNRRACSTPSPKLSRSLHEIAAQGAPEPLSLV